MYKVVYNDISRKDLSDILFFYKNIDQLILQSFLEEVCKIEKVLSNTPEIYRIRYESVRRVNFINFPFCLFYQIDGKFVQILKIVHQSRDVVFWP